MTVDGECAKPGTYTLEDVLAPHALEERIYRMRCVEAWSMVIPWNGFALADLIRRFEPTSKAKYVAFETVVQDDLPGVRRNVLDWPYREGLRMDEAMNPLSFVAVGMYGQSMPNQNGAPLRLVVPWKYGFKGIKSIVRMSFVERQPETSWNLLAPREYGFYSNVNPAVSQPALEPGQGAQACRGCGRAVGAVHPRRSTRCRSTATPSRSPGLYSGHGPEEAVLSPRRPRRRVRP